MGKFPSWEINSLRKKINWAFIENFTHKYTEKTRGLATSQPIKAPHVNVDGDKETNPIIETINFLRKASDVCWNWLAITSDIERKGEKSFDCTGKSDGKTVTLEVKSRAKES